MKGLRPIMVYSFAVQIEITPEGDTMISSLGEAELHSFISSFLHFFILSQIPRS